MQDDVDAEVGARLRELRNEIEWTQPQIAELLSRELGKRVDPTMVTKTEKGRRPILAAELLAYSQIYGVSVDQLLVPRGKIRFVFQVLDAADKLADAEAELLAAEAEYESRRLALHAALFDLTDELSFEDVPEAFYGRIRNARSIAERSVADVFADKLEREAETVMDDSDEE